MPVNVLHRECPQMPYRCNASVPLNFAGSVGKLSILSVLIENKILQNSQMLVELEYYTCKAREDIPYVTH